MEYTEGFIRYLNVNYYGPCATCRWLLSRGWAEIEYRIGPKMVEDFIAQPVSVYVTEYVPKEIEVKRYLADFTLLL